MDNKVFNRITKEVFLNYGFSKQKKYYILPLSDVTIVVIFRSWRGVKSFDYIFFINELYDSTIEFEDKYDTKIWIHMEHDPTLSGYRCHEILVEEWTEEEYRELLGRMLHSYFDPYKADALQFLRDNDSNMYLTKKARQYLGLE